MKEEEERKTDLEVEKIEVIFNIHLKAVSCKTNSKVKTHTHTPTELK